MRIFIKAKTGAKKEGVLEIDKTHYLISIKAQPVEGKANIAVVKALAKHFDISASRINILSGRASRQKIVEIL